MALGTYEEKELRYVLDRLPVGGGLIDVGAHIGYFTLAAAAKVGPSGSVIAIEPTPRSAETLRRNVAENEFCDRVRVIEGAASNVVGNGSLVVSDVSEMWNTLELDTLTSSTSIPVDLVTIDHAVGSTGWPDIHIIKLDVEGHERSVLLGAHETFERFPQVEILFEASGTSEERLRVSLETIRFLHERDFGLFQIEDAEAGRASTVAGLERRMQMPRWQDSLFNVVARRR